MKDTLLYLVTSIVDHAEDVTVDEVSDDQGHVTLTIHVHTEDMGKVIGKQGRIVRALRDLMKVLAAKENLYVDIVIAE